MDSYFSSRAPLASLADALCSESPISPISLCRLVLHDRYRLIKLLGQGRFSNTFLARDEHASESFCVIKQLSLHSQHGTDSRSLDRCRREAQRLAAVGEHPQMPQLLHTFEQDGQAFIVQEWIDGWTLKQEVAGGVPFDEVEVWQLLRDLLPVLQYLHDRQIIHRDIKPANIIRRRHADRTAGSKPHPFVLVDFGAAKQVGDARISTGSMIGNAEYAAPEQICGQAVFASDLYSLGVTCLYLLTQMSPFDLYDIGEATWKWQAYLAHPISSSLKQILCTLLQPTTRRRYQSAVEVLVVLDEVCTHHKTTKQGNPAIAPIALAKAEPLHLIQPRAADAFSSAAIAAINAARTVRPIATATVYNPQTRRWHHVTPTAETADGDSKVALCSSYRWANATTNLHGWEPFAPLCDQMVRRQTSLGWRLVALGLGTAVASVAMTCLLLCISIIVLALAVPPHSSTTPSTDPSNVLR